MRSVYVFLKKVQKDKVISKFNDVCENNNDLQWLYMKNDDPVLYIGFDKNNSFLNDSEENTKKQIEVMLCD
jgi:hypothetical protein